MRTLLFPITKAAHKRFGLLEENARLPMPLTPEVSAPFGFRFSGPFLCLTHDGRDVAYVSDTFVEAEKAVKVMIPLPESETLDAALRRTLSRITTHLTTVNSILAREQKERKEAEAAEAARRAEEIRNTPDPLAHLKGADTTGVLPHLTRADLHILRDADLGKRCAFPVYERDTGAFHLGWAQTHTVLEVRGDEVRFRENHQGLSAERVGRHLAETAAWARANNDPDIITAALNALPAPEFSILAYALRPIRPKDKRRPQPLGLADGVAVQFHPQQITVTRDGASVVTYNPPHRYGITEIRMVRDASECVTPSWHRNPMFNANAREITEDHLMRLGSAWLRAMAEADPEFSPADYAVADFDRVLEDAAREDAGYGF